LESQHFNNNGELMEGVRTWLSSEVAELLWYRHTKLFPRYNKCLNSGSDYVEK
jgi:hypothetical protein